MTDPVTPAPGAADPFEDVGVATHRVSADVAALTDQGRRATNEDCFAVFRLGRYLDRVTSNIPESELVKRVKEIPQKRMIITYCA